MLQRCKIVLLLTTLVNYLLGKSIFLNYNALFRRRVLITNLLSILSIVIFFVDVIQNHYFGFVVLAYIELVSLAGLIVNFISFRYLRNLSLAAGVLTSIQSFIAIIALVLPGYAEEMTIFWVSSLPLYIYFLHGIKRGTYYSLINIFALLIITAICYFDIYPVLFHFGVMEQILVGYIAVSIFVFYMEKIRDDYDVEIQSLASERKTLLKEVHHRVKNNMQVMIGLFWLQSKKIKNLEDRKIFDDNSKRLSAMALIHEHLYTLNNIENIDTKKYICSLVETLEKASDCTIEKNIEYIKISIKDAMNIGFIINEAILNSIQHAFINKKDKIVYVNFLKNENSIILSIYDNGDVIEDMSKLKYGFGLELIEDLSNTLLDSSINISVEDGFNIEIIFKAQVDGS